MSIDILDFCEKDYTISLIDTDRNYLNFSIENAINFNSIEELGKVFCQNLSFDVNPYIFSYEDYMIKVISPYGPFYVCSIKTKNVRKFIKDFNIDFNKINFKDFFHICNNDLEILKKKISYTENKIKFVEDKLKDLPLEFM